MLNTFQEVSGAIGVAINSAVFFDVVGQNFSPAEMREGFELAIWVPLVAVALTGLASFLLPSASQMVTYNKALEDQP